MFRARMLAPALLVATAAAAAAACSSGPTAPHGAPALISVSWVLGSGARAVVWSPPGAPDPTQVSTVAPFTTEVDFVFDRRLDGNRIEDTVVVGGVTTTVAKAVPPITTDPATDLQVLYNSSPIFGGETSYVLVQPRPGGFASSSTVTFALDRSSLTSPYDEPLPTPDTVQVATGPFTVDIQAADSGGAGGGADGGVPLGTDYKLPLAFSNRPGDPAAIAPFVHARAGGVDVPVALLADPHTATLYYLTPAACQEAWPIASTIEVTVDAGLPDAFGVGLAAGASATFTTGTGPRAPSVCAPASADGGATAD
jgi:hypothetical protein